MLAYIQPHLSVDGPLLQKLNTFITAGKHFSGLYTPIYSRTCQRTDRFCRSCASARSIGLQRLYQCSHASARMQVRAALAQLLRWRETARESHAITFDSTAAVLPPNPPAGAQPPARQGARRLRPAPGRRAGSH